MRRNPSADSKRSIRAVCVAVVMLLIVVVATRLKISDPDPVPTGESDLGQLTDSASTRNVDLSPPDNRRARGVLASRAAKANVPSPASHSSWGFLIAEDIVGIPRRGDVAYLARLGPDHGLMKVESVEGDRAVLTMGTLDRALIREGDRIETMPPLIPMPHESQSESSPRE